MASANRPYAPAANGSRYFAASPSAPACRTHPSDIRDKPPTRWEMRHTGSPRSADHTPASAAATEEFVRRLFFSAATKPAPRSRGTSPQTRLWIPTAATPAPPPPRAPAKSDRSREPPRSPENAAQSRPPTTLSPPLAHSPHAASPLRPWPTVHEPYSQTASAHTPASHPTRPSPVRSQDSGRRGRSR